MSVNIETSDNKIISGVPTNILISKCKLFRELFQADRKYNIELPFTEDVILFFISFIYELPFDEKINNKYGYFHINMCEIAMFVQYDNNDSTCESSEVIKLLNNQFGIIKNTYYSYIICMYQMFYSNEKFRNKNIDLTFDNIIHKPSIKITWKHALYILKLNWDVNHIINVIKSTEDKYKLGDYTRPRFNSYLSKNHQGVNGPPGVGGGGGYVSCPTNIIKINKFIKNIEHIMNLFIIKNELNYYII